MTQRTADGTVTIWLANDVPARLIFAARRWRVTDTPTPLQEDHWAPPLEDSTPLHGWRFQATEEQGNSRVFDVFQVGRDWHVHRVYN